MYINIFLDFFNVKFVWYYLTLICLICQLIISVNLLSSIVMFIWILSGLNSSYIYEQSNSIRPNDYFFTIWNSLISYVLPWSFFISFTRSVPICTWYLLLNMYGVLLHSNCTISGLPLLLPSFLRSPKYSSRGS